MFKGCCNILGDNVVVDKTIYVVLDGDESLIEDNSSKCHANNLKDLLKAIENRIPEIITPLTCIVSATIMEKGYNIIVYSEGKSVDFYDMANGDTSKSDGREIRFTQNWEKMLYSGCFDVEVDWRED